MDGKGIFLAILYWLAILLVVVAFAALAAVFFGALNSPELKEALQAALRKAGGMIHR